MGRYPQLSLQGAREKAREALERLSYGDDPGKQKDNPTRFEAAFAVFMERHVAQTRGTYETRRIYNHDLLPNFQKKLLSQVSRKDVINLLDEIVDRRAPIMANRVLAVLRKFYSWAIARDLTTNNPSEVLKPPSKQRSRNRIHNEEEFNIFWRACEAMGYPYGTYFQFLLLSAQRRSEVAETTFEEIQGYHWVIPALRAKNGIKHTVPMTDKMLSLLRSTGRDTGFVFTATGDRPINNLGRAAKRLKTLM